MRENRGKGMKGIFNKCAQWIMPLAGLIEAEQTLYERAGSHPQQQTNRVRKMALTGFFCKISLFLKNFLPIICQNKHLNQYSI